MRRLVLDEGMKDGMKEAALEYAKSSRPHLSRRIGWGRERRYSMQKTSDAASKAEHFR